MGTPIRTLLKFCAPVEFVWMLQKLYMGAFSQILSNCFLSNLFLIQQGTRQGCPLSPLLFAVAIEPLAVELQTSPKFRCILLGDKEVKLSMFADDMLLFISFPIDSLTDIIAILYRFSTFAGFWVNYSKSNLQPLVQSPLL